MKRDRYPLHDYISDILVCDAWLFFKINLFSYFAYHHICDNGSDIVYRLFPNYQMQAVAISRNSKHIRFIRNPHPAVQLEAVQLDAANIELIKNPCEKAQLSVVNDGAIYIRMIERPTQKVIRLAINNDPSEYEYINFKDHSIIFKNEMKLLCT
ncbi:MAG: hypothetical protein DRG78_00455 [Epsilonproteobacteria bacterium]|nr:MAG: hypothetical protein DRG78_00455 [Campylobacterota bacterium]